MASATSVGAQNMISIVQRIIPSLSGSNHKGSHGKIGVVGGCMEYTGAPFFAAISAMRVGADLAYVFCTPSAGPVIKTYSPELIVIPCLPEVSSQVDDAVRSQAVAHALHGVTTWLSRLSCLVVGPGLGDDPVVVDAAMSIMLEARSQGIPLLVDGSGLNIVAKQPHLVQGYPLCVLTPNMAELGRLANGVGVKLEGPIGSQWQEAASEIAAGLRGPVLVSKGPADIIIGSSQQVRCEEPATPRRCGGQGDILAGSIAVMVSWALRHSRSAEEAGGLIAGQDPLVLASFGGCLLTRAASTAAFKSQGRAMLAGDIIQQLGPVFETKFGTYR